jgi:hypothetical protein
MRLVLHPKVYSEIGEIMRYYERVAASEGSERSFTPSFVIFVSDQGLVVRHHHNIHLLDLGVDRSMAELEECRLEWSWILIGTSGGGGRDSESIQASWNVSHSKTNT